ncbi:uncharacterized protein LOC134221058 [Armigeres subalbatus]|uniref:uncharacterized protein LOC134221058 n=1 Tax=Armigeres subalbatus TaxID=124917 RepID=UPI002ECFEE49
MKGTLWLCTLVTILVCVRRQVSGQPFTDRRIIQPQDNSLVSPAKRTKASLSIVNPLDVLRQRIILEMARRRMQENSMQVARNQAILREIGKRSHDVFPQDENPLHFGSPDRFHHDRVPLERRYGYLAPQRQLEDDLGSAENQEPAGISSNSVASSRDGSDSLGSATSETGKQINDRKEISSSRDNSGGVLTLAAEQRQLEREQQEAQQEAHKILHSAVANGGPQEMRFSNERVMLPNNLRDDDDGDGENDDEEVEYFQSSYFPSGRGHTQLQQHLPRDDERINSDDNRLRYLYRIQDKYFG